MKKPTLVSHHVGHDWVSVRHFVPDIPKPRPIVVHEHAAVVLYRGGHARFWLQGTYELGSGDVLIIPAGAPHCAMEASGALSMGVSLCLSCMVSPSRRELKALFRQVHHGGCASRHLEPQAAERMAQIVEGIERENASAKPGRELMLDALVSEMTVLLMRAGEHHPVALSAGHNPLTVKALTFIHQHATDGISLHDVSKHVALTAAHIATTVKQETGLTVGDWIAQTRMSTARQLLLHTDETVEMVAQRCGFASTSHFHRSFKKMHKSSPGTWRQQYWP